MMWLFIHRIRISPPFDVGAYASSTTYISGGAVIRAADKVARSIAERAVNMLKKNNPTLDITADEIDLFDKKAIAPDGSFVTLEEIALNALHHTDQEQIMAVGSFVSESSPPPFAAQFAEVVVDTKTGQVRVEKTGYGC